MRPSPPQSALTQAPRSRRSAAGAAAPPAALGAAGFVAVNEQARERVLGLLGAGGSTQRGRLTWRPRTSRADASAAELVKQLSEQTSRLVRQEMELAKAELSVKGKQVGIGAGLFGGAGVFGLYALGALTAAAIAGLGEVVAVWLAALIVTVIWAAVAAVMALVGKGRVQAGTPPVPEQTVDSTKEDVRWAKESAQRGRR